MITVWYRTNYDIIYKRNRVHLQSLTLELTYVERMEGLAIVNPQFSQMCFILSQS